MAARQAWAHPERYTTERPDWHMRPPPTPQLGTRHMTTEDEMTPEGEHIFTPDQPLPPDALGRYTLGYDVHDDAAAVLGKTRTEFMIESARLSAPVSLTAEHDLSAFDCGEPGRLASAIRRATIPAAVRSGREAAGCAAEPQNGYGSGLFAPTRRRPSRPCASASSPKG